MRLCGQWFWRCSKQRKRGRGGGGGGGGGDCIAEVGADERVMMCVTVSTGCSSN